MGSAHEVNSYPLARVVVSMNSTILCASWFGEGQDSFVVYVRVSGAACCNVPMQYSCVNVCLRVTFLVWLVAVS